MIIYMTTIIQFIIILILFNNYYYFNNSNCDKCLLFFDIESLSHSLPVRIELSFLYNCLFIQFFL